MTTELLYNVLGIGNAIVDIVSPKDEAFLHSQELAIGSMTLIDEARATALYEHMSEATSASGGSAANTMAGFASLSGRAAFIGKVKKDPLGDVFAQDMHRNNVHFATPPAMEGSATAQCLIFVSQDATGKVERTMATYLGACREISTLDIDERLVADSEITYFEGYLWDMPEAKQAMLKAMETAKQAGRKVAFTLSDSFCVGRHRDEFLTLVKNHVDILFANESEILSLTQTTTFDDATRATRGLCETIALTRSEKGCVILNKNSPEAIALPAIPTNNIADVTGAGDLFASGFLYGYTHFFGADGNPDLRRAGTLANLTACEILQVVGARTAKPLKELLTKC